jgi:hypothetical protein
MAKYIADQKENIVNKIRQCMELSKKAGTSEESQGALLKAQELMVKYNISLDGIKEAETKMEVKEIVDEEFTPRKRNRWWVKSLAYVIAKNFKCTSYIKSFSNANCVCMIGLKEDVDIAREVFNYAGLEIEKFSKEYTDTKCNNSYFFNDKSYKSGVKNDYINGYIDGLNTKFEAQVEENGWGLVLVQDALVVKAVEDKGLKKLRNAPVNNSNDGGAYRKGYQDGKSFGRKLGE